MGYNIGPKIGIEGEQEFRSAIKKINDSYKALEAESRALAAAFDAQGDEQGKLEAASKQLQKQIDSQREKQTLLESAVKKATEKFGEESIEATRLRGALYDTKATVTTLESELKGVASRLENAGDAMDEFGDNADEAGDAAISFGDILKANLSSDVIMDAVQELGDLVKDFASDAIEAAADISAENAKFAQSFKGVEKEAKKSLDAIADESGITSTRIQDSYSSIYAFAKTVGAESDQALNLSSRAMKAAADSAAYYDKSIEDVTETLQSFLKGNYENDAALGISATETSRNTMANQMYAKSFIELSESQKVDVLLAMVEAGNLASGALGQAAREAESWTNVTGELDEAWRQFLGVIGSPVLEAITPTILEITEALRHLSEKTGAEEFAETIDDLEESIRKSNERLAETETTLTANAILAERYVKRLDSLKKAGLDTAAAQKEYADVVAVLNELMPDLNLQISEQTGLVNKSSEAILLNVDALKQKALQEAMMENYSDYLNAYAQAQVQIAEAERALIPLQEKEKLLLEEIGKNTENTAWATGIYSNQVRTIPEPLRILTEALTANQTEQRQYAEALDEGKENLDKYGKEIEKLEALLGDLTEVQISAGESGEKLAGAQSKQTEKAVELKLAVDGLRNSYLEAKDSARDSIDAQIGYFDELASSSDYAADKIVDNWKAQQTAFSNYSANLQKAVDMGLDETLVKQLANGTEESMLILDALVNDTDLSVDDINASFEKMVKARDVTSAVMADIQTDMSAKLNAMAKNADKEWGEMADLAKWHLDGIQDSINALTGKTVYIDIVARDGSSGSGREEDFGDGVNNVLSERLNRAAEYPFAVQRDSSASVSVSHDYGGLTFQIYQQPGESGEDLAYRIMEIMQQEVDAKEAGIGG